MPLGRAHMLASSIVRDARRAGISADTISPVGSLRRFAPDVGDVALLGTVPPATHPDLLRAFARLPAVLSTSRETATSIRVQTARGIVALHLAAPDDAGAALVWHTGSRSHTAQLSRRAADAGLCFGNATLTDDTGTPIPCLTEAEFYRHLDLPFIAPELRNGTGEIDAAAAGRLPQLVAEGHIRGDLHTHSTWSDGQDTIADVVSAAKQLGYDYVAITDHSESAWSSRKLARTDVQKQRKEVDALRETVTGIEILHGIEVDIMPDGTLDFDDDLLRGFDIVLASLHDSGGHNGRRLTERYLKTIDHPLVNVITHPANRSPAQSAGYALDFDRLFTAAIETGTALEIDGAPGHLDLDGDIARQAAAAGVTLVIDSDCHRIESLARQMRFGVGTARRGWVEPRHVLNTRTTADVRAFIARKRSRA
jgi:DNA polymerase (family 10)